MHELQVYEKTRTIEGYIRGRLAGVALQKKREMHFVGVIERGSRRLLGIAECVRRRLGVFERQVGRVMRVITRRTRTYYFPCIKEYTEM